MPKGELYFRKVEGVTYKTGVIYKRVVSQQGAISFVQDNTGDWVDTYEQWGVSFSDGAISALLTPAGNKAPVENESRLEHGKRVIKTRTYVKNKDRDLNLEMHLSARNKSDFFTKYDALCQQVFDNGFIDILSVFIADRVYKVTYDDCSQFRAFINGLAKYTLKVNEPNPKDRSI